MESAEYEAEQVEASTEGNARAVVEAIIIGLFANGVEARVSGSFTPAADRTADNPNGTNGSYTFTVTLNKGTGNEQPSTALTLTIIATPYDPTDDNLDIADALAALEGEAYMAVQPEASDIAAAKLAVEAIIAAAIDNFGVDAVVEDGVFIPAVEGTADNPYGTNGKYTFSVTLSKGQASTLQVTGTLTLTILAPAYVELDVDFESLTANGSSGVTSTTELTLTLSEDVAGFTASDIIVTGTTAGALTNTAAGVYRLAISDITVADGGNVTVELSKPGYIFTPSSKTVAVYKADTAVNVPVTGVSLNKNATLLTVGGTGTLIATVSPGNATNKAVVWRSGNTAVVTVNAYCYITAVSVGITTITVATVDGSKTATCTVTVTSGDPVYPGDSDESADLGGGAPATTAPSTPSGGGGTPATTAPSTETAVSVVNQTAAQVNNAIAVTETTGMATSRTYKVSAKPNKDEKDFGVRIAAETYVRALDAKATDITVNFGTVLVNMPVGVLTAVNTKAEAKDLRVVTSNLSQTDFSNADHKAIVNDATRIFELNVYVGDTRVSEGFTGLVNITLPVTKADLVGLNLNNLFVTNFRNDAEGKLVTQNIPATYDATKIQVRFKTAHFSTFALKSAAVTLKDLEGVSWAKPSITSMASKGVIAGRGDGIFDPQSNITRAEFAALVVRMVGGGIRTQTDFYSESTSKLSAKIPQR